MHVRFTTTAGRHLVGATFLATNMAPLLDLDRHFMRSTLQTGPTPGYTFFPHVGTIRIEGPYNAKMAKDSPSRRKIFICTPTGRRPTKPTCARRIVTNLATRAFRRPATTADVNLLMDFYKEGRGEGTFDDGIEFVLARLLASPQFVYRIEEEPATVKAGQAYRISDVDLASRLSFFLWSTGPDDQLLKLATEGRLKNAGGARAAGAPDARRPEGRRARHQLRRSVAESARSAEHADRCRSSIRTSTIRCVRRCAREVELLFDSVVREDRSVRRSADGGLHLRERAAGAGTTASRTSTAAASAAWRCRRRSITAAGCSARARSSTTTAKPERTSPVTRGKWIMTNILGMSPPDPPPDVPALPPRAGDAAGNAKEPTMRKKMEDHRVRNDCVQCHRLMDPIGFSLENFDGIASWRTLDEGQPIDAAAQTFDNTQINGPSRAAQLADLEVRGTCS